MNHVSVRKIIIRQRMTTGNQRRSDNNSITCPLHEESIHTLNDTTISQKADRGTKNNNYAEWNLL